MAVNKPDLRRIWAAGAPALNVQDPDDVEAGKFNAGWVAEIPPFEFFNFLHQLFTRALAHVNERGVSEWDADTEYLGSRSYTTGSDGEIYIAVITNTGNDPTTDDGTNWITLREYFIDSVEMLTAIRSLAIGEGQTWQNLTASRAANVNYTNSTGKTIMVNVYRTDTVNGAYLTVDGVTVGAVNPEPAVGSTISAIVPNGSTYRFSDSFNIWAELR